ncbi:MAG: hypothetical protein NT028_11340, partial [candidate division Zixibacteria bacterium]|nr:hypothetical protein [candidate division Zixibacteria bacterium]
MKQQTEYHSKPERKTMANNKPWVATIYFYLISAVCIITLIIALASGLMALYTLIDPESGLDKYEWKTYADSDEFKRTEANQEVTRTKSAVMAPTDSTGKPVVYSDEEWQRRWNSHRATTIRAEKMGARRNLVNQLIIV